AGARLRPHVARVAFGRGLGQPVGERRAVVLVDPAVVAGEQLGDAPLAAGLRAELLVARAEHVLSFRPWRAEQGGGLRAEALEARALGREIGGLDALVGFPLGDAPLERLDALGEMLALLLARPHARVGPLAVAAAPEVDDRHALALATGVEEHRPSGLRRRDRL